MDDAHNRIDAVLQKRFLDNEAATSHFGPLLTEYVASGLNRAVISELETGDEHKLWSNIWEAMLYRHLRNCGHAPYNRSARGQQHGPDFAIDVDGRTIWLEAVVPTPEGIPEEWIEVPRKGEIKVRTKPDAPRVLRCTQAIAEKRTKFAKYLADGIIGANDYTVIAVNICRLSYHDIEGTGISQFPLCAEAVFPIGPRGFNVSRDGKIVGPMSFAERYELPKANGKSVNTWAFLDDSFANVSAVLQVFERWLPDKGLPVAIIHNPTAYNPLPRGLFTPYSEYVGDPVDDGSYRVHDIAPRRA